MPFRECGLWRFPRSLCGICGTKSPCRDRPIVTYGQPGGGLDYIHKRVYKPVKILVTLFLTIACAAPAAAGGPAAYGALRASLPASSHAFDIPVPAAPARAEAGGEMGDRLFSASARFLGVPYVLGPLGEGEGGEFDRDPLVGGKGLDCTTFVEQSMAFALGRDNADALSILRFIRYRGGAVAYESRNHFTEADWLPNNIAMGFLRDITAEVAGPGARSVSKTISKRAWYAAKTEADLAGFGHESPAERAARAARLRALGENIPDQRVTLAYVPLEDLPRLLNSIPHGTVVSVVREDRADKPTLVTHQLFIFDGRRGKVIRHAAQGRQVLDVDAAQYIAGLAGAQWRVLGFNLAAVLPE